MVALGTSSAQGPPPMTLRTQRAMWSDSISNDAAV
jgi:hypothetical protein